MVDFLRVFQLEMFVLFTSALHCATLAAHLILLGSMICYIRYKCCLCYKICCFVTDNECYSEIIVAVQFKHKITNYEYILTVIVLTTCGI